MAVYAVAHLPRSECCNGIAEADVAQLIAGKQNVRYAKCMPVHIYPFFVQEIDSLRIDCQRYLELLMKEGERLQRKEQQYVTAIDQCHVEMARMREGLVAKDAECQRLDKMVQGRLRAWVSFVLRCVIPTRSFTSKTLTLSVRAVRRRLNHRNVPTKASVHTRFQSVPKLAPGTKQPILRARRTHTSIVSSTEIRICTAATGFSGGYVRACAEFTQFAQIKQGPTSVPNAKIHTNPRKRWLIT
jgi:hypothetical protein